MCGFIATGCATSKPFVPTTMIAPAALWYEPVLPHHGDVANLKDWWSRWEDPRLDGWIEKAQLISPTVVEARAVIFRAQATAIAQDVLLRPQIGAVANANRSRAESNVVPSTVLSTGLQASWALDLWGANAISARQSRAQVKAADAEWHAARVLVAGELARAYFRWHACDIGRGLMDRQAESLNRAQNSVAAAKNAGLLSGSDLTQIQVLLYETRSRVRFEAQQCNNHVKVLVALTGLPEFQLRNELLQESTKALHTDGSLAFGHLLSVPSVPASALRQRPDVWQSQWALAAASDAVGVSRAQLLPSLSLSASWLRNNVRNASNFTTWSFGPLAISIPLIGRAGLNARADASAATYEAATTSYRAVLRRAISEVETELVALSAQDDRHKEAIALTRASAVLLNSQESLERAGLSNLVKREEALRQWLAAQQSQLTLQLERINTWINLYVAIGGGFEPEGIALSKGRKTS